MDDVASKDLTPRISTPRISCGFDGGNIEWLDGGAPGGSGDPGDSGELRLAIRRDGRAEFYQWFYFRATGAAGRERVLRIVNAGGASYKGGWEDYRAVASYDRQTWFRVPSAFDGESLTIRHRPERESVYYAYFAPYSMERHADLIAKAQGSPLVGLRVLGSTLDGQDLDLLEIGRDAKGARVCWVIARQHPGETMAAWWMEGFLARLLDAADPLARALLAEARFLVVPNMNPDGGRRGHLRTNAAGANLNREWRDASLERSPEVFLVREAMRETGVDFCLDVHGDEVLPYNFIAGSEGIASWNGRLEALLRDYKNALQRANPDFQTRHGYPAAASGKANMAMCTNYIAETFGCLAMTLEMPFKDTADTPDEAAGWSPERCRKLGAANLDALRAVIGELR